MDAEVVIVGGGFAGLYAAKALGKAPVHVTLIDKRNFHLFQPLLYQVATGGLSPGDIAAPLRWVLRRNKNTQVLLGEVNDIDVAGKRVLMGERAIRYHQLIVAAGAVPSYFGHPEWAQHAPSLKTIEDATDIRRRMFYAFEAAEREEDPEVRRRWLTFVIVGAGPTGVELAGALGEIANETLKGDFRRIRTEESQILLIDFSPRVLQVYPESLSYHAEQALIRLGVRTRCGVKVTAIDAEGVSIETSKGTERITARTVFWGAGVQASPLARSLAEQTGAELDRAGRIKVEPDLTLKGHREIFVLGDMAHCPNPDGTMVPGVCPAAVQMGQYAAERIARRIKGEPQAPAFRYWNKGELATIGRASAVANFGSLQLSGFFAWFTWVFVHILYLVGFQNRLLVLVQWAFHYFTFNRGARLITKDPSIS
ncbi:MAG: NAD(P)/FAD-dependent oxidoreductase [Bryobacterales bacterium]|nr:NAD(P)/FAD-dependent oxidoreductase [Bryobacterales bacterium]